MSVTLSTATQDVARETGAGRERDRRALLTTMSSLAFKALSIGTTILTARWGMAYLGAEGFGLWMTVVSLQSLLVFLDLGLGNSALNAVAHGMGRDDTQGIRETVSTAAVMLGGLALAVIGLLGAVYAFLPWDRALGAPAGLAAGPAAAAIVVCIALNLAVSLVQRVQVGIQEGYISSLWQAFGLLLGLAGLALAIRLQAGLPVVVLMTAGGPVVAGALNGAALFWRHPELAPRWSLFSPKRARALLRRGGLFVGFAVMSAVAFASDPIVAAHTTGQDGVAAMAVHSRLFQFCSLLVGLHAGSLWPAYGEAFARGDHAWIAASLKRTLGAGFIVTLLPALVLVPLAPWVLQLWLGRPVDSPASLRLGYAAWTLASGIGFTVGQFLSAVNMLRFNLAISAVMTVLAVGLKIPAGLAFGPSGIIWAVTGAYAVSLLPCLWFVPRLLGAIRRGAPPREDVLWMP